MSAIIAFTQDNPQPKGTLPIAGMPAALPPFPPGFAAIGDEPAADPLAEAHYVAHRLLRHSPHDRRSYDVLQASLAIAGSSARLLCSGSLSFASARSLLPLLRELDVVNALGRPTAAIAVKLDLAFAALADELREPGPALQPILQQVQRDVTELARAGRVPSFEDGAPVPCNPAPAAAAALAAQATQAASAAPADARLDALQAIAASALVLAANLGGTDMPTRVQAVVQGLLGQISGVLEGRIERVQQAGVLMSTLTVAVHILEDCLDSGHGCRNALLAMCHDLGELAKAALQP